MAKEQDKMTEFFQEVRGISQLLLSNDPFVKREYDNYEKSRERIGRAVVVAGLGVLGAFVGSQGGDMGMLNTALQVGGYATLAGGAVAASISIGQVAASWDALKNYPKVKETTEIAKKAYSELPGNPILSDDAIVADIIRTGNANDYAEYLDKKRSKLDKEDERLDQRKADLQDRKDFIDDAIRTNDKARGIDIVDKDASNDTSSANHDNDREM